MIVGDGVPLVGPQDERARGKRRGFGPGAPARHSQYARVYTEFLQKHLFFSPYFRVQPVCFSHQTENLCRLMCRLRHLYDSMHAAQKPESKLKIVTLSVTNWSLLLLSSGLTKKEHEHAVATTRVSKNLQQGRAGGAFWLLCSMHAVI